MITKIIEDLDKLGIFLSNFLINNNNHHINNDEYKIFNFELSMLIKNIYKKNAWFTTENIKNTLFFWSQKLKKDKLYNWINNYNITPKKSKIVGVIMAGNIPLVGFHDFLCVLISGHKIHIKTSYQDNILLPFLCKILYYINNTLKKYIFFYKILNFNKVDAMIVTGNNNTFNYFNYKLKNHKKIIRNGRFSVAILNGNETKKDLHGLSKDIMMYFGRGCRSVRKIFIPNNYNISIILNIIKIYYSNNIKNIKYNNNYKYYKIIFNMNNIKFIFNDYIILKEDITFYPPISIIYFEYYKNINDVFNKIRIHENYIQCIISNKIINNTNIKNIKFGFAHSPELNEYADNIDTLKFLEKI